MEKSNMKVFCFSDMLKAAMKAEHIGYSDISNMLEEKGIEINTKRLSEYGREVSTPPYEKAVEICKVLDIDMDEEYLLESLRLNRERIKENKVNGYNPGGDYGNGSEKNIIKCININYKGFISGMTAEQVEARINERIETLYGKSGGGRNRLAMYIRDLIKQDISVEK